MNRRDFIKSLFAAAMVSAVPSIAAPLHIEFIEQIFDYEGEIGIAGVIKTGLNSPFLIRTAVRFSSSLITNKAQMEKIVTAAKDQIIRQLESRTYCVEDDMVLEGNEVDLAA